MGLTFYFQWEVDLMVRLQQWMGSGMITAAKLFTEIGGEIVVVLLMLLLYWCINKEWGIDLGTNLLTGLGVNTQLKNLVLRRRPYFDHPDIHCLSPVDSTGDLFSVQAQGFSFPSMHSANALILFGTIAMEIRRRPVTLVAILLTFCIGLSRVILGNHYPTDVLMGWIVGLIVLFGIALLKKKVREKWKCYLAIFLITLPGVFYARTNDYFTIFGAMIGFFAAVIFEEKKVHFKDTRNVLHIVLRMVFGAVIFLALDTLCKMPFSVDFLNGGSGAAHLVRTLRYAIILFVEGGLYPILFNKWKCLE